MSLRAGTTGLISGALTASLYSGLGATGAIIKAASATGTDGAGPLFNDGLIDASEYYWYVVNAPVTGILTLYENGQADFVPAANGTVTWTYALVEDGVLLSPQPTVTIEVGILISTLKASPLILFKIMRGVT